MVVIRKAELEEVNKILDIKESIFGEELVGTYEECFKQIEEHGHWFRTAKQDGIIIGYINGVPLNNQELELSCICVSPEKQNEKIGDLLMKSYIFIAQQKGIQKIFLKCDEEYIGFFAKYGFEAVLDSQQYNMELNTTVPRCSCACSEH